MNTRIINLAALLALVGMLACGGDASYDLTWVGMAITFDDDLATSVTQVDASIWEAGDMGTTSALSSASSTDSGSIDYLRLFVPGSVSAVDVQCTAYNASSGVVGYGVVFNQSLSGGQNSIGCTLIASTEGGTPIRMAISLDNSHVFDSAIVSPEPAECDTDFTVDFDVTVSDTDSDAFTFYVTGGHTEAKLNAGTYANLDGNLISYAGEASGGSDTIQVHWSGVDASTDLLTNVWAIDPDTNQGQVLRTTTNCDATGLHDVNVLPVPYFYGSASLAFDITYSADGTDLTWSCDRDLDGVVDETATITDIDLLGVVASAPAFDLILDNGSSVSKQTVDCSP